MWATQRKDRVLTPDPVSRTLVMISESVSRSRLVESLLDWEKRRVVGVRCNQVWFASTAIRRGITAVRSFTKATIQTGGRHSVTALERKGCIMTIEVSCTYKYPGCAIAVRVCPDLAFGAPVQAAFAININTPSPTLSWITSVKCRVGKTLACGARTPYPCIHASIFCGILGWKVCRRRSSAIWIEHQGRLQRRCYRMTFCGKR